jgi:protein-disulfide isomerase-like protein with CxxC motif
MSRAVEDARHRLRDEVRFDVLLGGINTHGTQNLGEFGRRHLMKIWQEVHATTGETFGFRLPDVLIYNSTLPCVAVEAIRTLTGAPPFGYLHRLQALFFVEGININEREVLIRVADEFGIAEGDFVPLLDSDRTQALVQFQFETSRAFGTNALPSLLWEEQDGERTLFAGGYMDADMLSELARARLAGDRGIPVP